LPEACCISALAGAWDIRIEALHFAWVAIGDIRGHANHTAFWHIAMPVEESSTASESVVV
jgi:hypothetical protein